MIKVSIILPVYGVAQYIEKCAQSLLSQTLQEMEFIFVDDHGPDNSIELVQKMIEGHPRKDQFRFLKPEHNMGAGMARNYAIPEAKGEYIAFVDSDDWVKPMMFEELYNEAVRNGNTDLCCCQMQKIYPDNHLGDILQNPHISAGEISSADRSFILTHYVSLFTSFIYKRSFIEEYNIRFPEDRCADDSYFVSSVWMLAKSIAYVDKPFYMYLIRPGSVVTTKDSTKYQKRLTVFEKLMHFAKSVGVYDSYKEEIDFMYIKKGYLSSVFNYVTNSVEPQVNTLHEIYGVLLSQVPDYKKNRYFKSKASMKLLVLGLRTCPKLVFPLIRMYASKKQMMV